jgi:dipeptidyl aminopeptidase/acylaminoacyl peptidase
MKHLLLAGVALAVSTAPVLARDLTIQDVATLSRVGSPAVSPDGHWLVWQQRETDLAANKGRYDLWRLDLTVKGAKPEKLVAEADVNETAPQFSADGKTIWFQSDKGGDRLRYRSVPVTGGTATQVYYNPNGFSGFKVAPTGDKILDLGRSHSQARLISAPRWLRRTRTPALVALMTSCSCATGIHGATARARSSSSLPLSGSSGANGITASPSKAA